MTPAIGSEKRQQLQRLASRIRSDPDFMASILADYQKEERLSDSGLADRLGMAEEQLPLLALCRRPDSDDKEFAQQIRQISEYTGANLADLAQVIRQVEAVSRLKSVRRKTDSERDAKPAGSPSPFLSAARDHEHQVSESGDEYDSDISDDSDNSHDADESDQ